MQIHCCNVFMRGHDGSERVDGSTGGLRCATAYECSEFVYWYPYAHVHILYLYVWGIRVPNASNGGTGSSYCEWVKCLQIQFWLMTLHCSAHGEQFFIGFPQRRGRQINSIVWFYNFDSCMRVISINQYHFYRNYEKDTVLYLPIVTSLVITWYLLTHTHTFWLWM